MQIVIDIPDKDVPNKQEIIDISLHFIDGEVCECTYPYIVLPKGHGLLIDADALYDQFEYADYDFEKTLEYAPTIIEADKAEGSEEV